MNENKYPAAVTVGYISIFISLFIFVLVWSGWIVTTLPEWGPYQLIFDGMLIGAGIFALSNKDKADSILFLTLGTFWEAMMLRNFWYPALPANTGISVLDGWICLLLTIVTLCLLFVSLKGDFFRKLFLLTMSLVYLCIAIGNLFNSMFFMSVFVFLGLIAAILAGIYGISTIVDFGKFKKA